MTDETDSTETSYTAPSPVKIIYGGFRRLLYIIGGALIIWMIVGQKLMPTSHPAPPVQKAAPEPTPAADIKPEDSAPPPPPPPPPPPEAAAPPEPPREVLDTASKERIAHLEEQLDKQSEALQALEHRLGDMQARNAAQLTAITALSQLKDRLTRGEPFAAQLQLFSASAPGDDTRALIVQLSPLADKGVASLPSLRGQFERLLPQALAPDVGDNWATRTLHSLIRIRKVGDQPGNDDEAVIARAEAKLNRGELDGAITELMALSPMAREVFAPWVTLAKNRVSALIAADALQLAVLQDKEK